MKHSALKFAVKASLFNQLAVMEDAGVPFHKAIGWTRLPPGAQARLNDMRKRITLGQAVADAGLSSGLFTQLESSLLRAACNAGSPSHTYRRLSRYYSRRAGRAAAMKSRMSAPIALIVIAFLLNPLPDLIVGTLSIGGYLLKFTLPLIALGGGAYLSKRVLPLAPWFNSISERRNVRDFFDSLALLLEAVPILDALPIAVDAIQYRPLKQKFSSIEARIKAGNTFAQAIGELPFVGQATAHAMILTGESGGKLSEVLFRYSEAETAAIDRFDDLVAEWIPRAVYITAAVSIGYGIISSGVFMP